MDKDKGNKDIAEVTKIKRIRLKCAGVTSVVEVNKNDTIGGSSQVNPQESKETMLSVTVAAQGKKVEGNKDKLKKETTAAFEGFGDTSKKVGKSKKESPTAAAFEGFGDTSKKVGKSKKESPAAAFEGFGDTSKKVGKSKKETPADAFEVRGNYKGRTLYANEKLRRRKNQPLENSGEDVLTAVPLVPLSGSSFGVDELKKLIEEASAAATIKVLESEKGKEVIEATFASSLKAVEASCSSGALKVLQFENDRILKGQQFIEDACEAAALKAFKSKEVQEVLKALLKDVVVEMIVVDSIKGQKEDINDINDGPGQKEEDINDHPKKDDKSG